MPSPPVQPSEGSGPSRLILIFVEGVWAACAATPQTSVLVLLLLTSSNAAFGGKKAPKFNEIIDLPTIDLPQTFDVDSSVQQCRERNLVRQEKCQTILRPR